MGAATWGISDVGSTTFQRSDIRIRGKMRDPESIHVERHACATCGIAYYVAAKRRPDCPLCSARAQVAVLRNELRRLSGAHGLVRQERDLLAQQLDVYQAMVAALEVASERDRAFVREVVTDGERRPDARLHLVSLVRPSTEAFIGFRWADGDYVVRHLCDSVGGVALVGAYARACREFNMPRSVQLLRKAIAAVEPHTADA